MDAIAAHSGEYVERLKTFTTVRVDRLVPLMGIGPTDRIADFGCGTGIVLRALPTYGTYDGVDFSADFIDAAREMSEGYPNARFHCADIVDFCADHQSSFDVATTFDFSEHIDDETFYRIYRAIRSSLAPGGRLYFHTPNLDFIIEQLKDKGIMRQFDEHIAVRSAKRNADMLRECGFNNVNVQIIPHYNVLKHLHPLSRLPLVGRLFGARVWINAS